MSGLCPWRADITEPNCGDRNPCLLGLNKVKAAYTQGTWSGEGMQFGGGDGWTAWGQLGRYAICVDTQIDIYPAPSGYQVGYQGLSHVQRMQASLRCVSADDAWDRTQVLCFRKARFQSCLGI